MIVNDLKRSASKHHTRTVNSFLNLMTSLVGQGISLVLKFVTRTIFIYTLGKNYLGINGLFSDVLTMLSLSELGIDSAITYQLYKPLAEHDDKRVRVLLKFYKHAYRVVGIFIVVAGLCLIPLLPRLIRGYDTLAPLGIDAELIFVLYLIQSASSYLFFAYRTMVLKANQKKYILDVADYAVTFVSNVVQILVLVILRDFIAYTASMIAFIIIRNLVNAVIATRDSPQYFIKEKDSLAKSEILGLFKDCGALFIYKLNYVVLTATDNLVLSSFIGLGVVGLYSNYLVCYATIKTLISQVYTAVKASTGNLFATGSIEIRYRFFQVMNYLTVLLYGTAAVGIAVCADELIVVWIGPEFTIGRYFSVLLGLELLLHGLKINLGQIRDVSGVFRQMWFRPVIGATVNLVASVILVQHIGINGVIIGTILSDLLSHFLIDPYVIHKYSFESFRPVSDYYQRNLVYVLLIVVIFLVDKRICEFILPDYGWISLITHICIVVLSILCVFSLLYRNSYEQNYLLDTIKRLLTSIH